MEWMELGYWGMFFSSILAATLLPFGSEAVFIGLLYAKYDEITLIVVAGTGNTIGGMITYYIGRLGKWGWLEKWFGISKTTIDKYMLKIQKNGWLYAFFTWLPGVGDPLAAGIGFARIPLVISTFWMFVGKTMRFFVLALMYKYGIEWF